MNVSSLALSLAAAEKRLALQLETTAEVRAQLAAANARAEAAERSLVDYRRWHTELLASVAVATTRAEAAEKLAEEGVVTVATILNANKAMVNDRDRWRERAEAAAAMRVKAAERDLNAERDGNMDLRRQYGARDDETMAMFVGRLAYHAERAEAAAGRMREALIEMAMAYGDGDHAPWYCSRCERWSNHAPDCIVGLALADPTGAEAHKELVRLRRLLGHIVDILGNEEDDAAARRAITHYVQAALDAKEQA